MTSEDDVTGRSRTSGWQHPLLPRTKTKCMCIQSQNAAGKWCTVHRMRVSLHRCSWGKPEETLGRCQPITNIINSHWLSLHLSRKWPHGLHPLLSRGSFTLDRKEPPSAHDLYVTSSGLLSLSVDVVLIQASWPHNLRVKRECVCECVCD